MYLTDAEVQAEVNYRNKFCKIWEFYMGYPASEFARRYDLAWPTRTIGHSPTKAVRKYLENKITDLNVSYSELEALSQEFIPTTSTTGGFSVYVQKAQTEVLRAYSTEMTKDLSLPMFTTFDVDHSSFFGPDWRQDPDYGPVSTPIPSEAPPDPPSPPRELNAEALHRSWQAEMARVYPNLAASERVPTTEVSDPSLPEVSTD